MNTKEWTIGCDEIGCDEIVCPTTWVDVRPDI